jgi:hypothetical protein
MLTAAAQVEIEDHLDDKPPPALHYGRTEPRLLGETLVMAAQLSFNKGTREATYDCNGQWFRYRAGGRPFEVNVTVFTPDGEAPFFTLLAAADGLTFNFAKATNLPPIAQVVMNAARDQAVQMRHSI